LQGKRRQEQHLHDGEPRTLVRRAMVDRLPSEVLSNRKRGLQAADWFERSTSVRGEIAAELTRLEECDLARMRRLVEQWSQGGWGETQVVEEYSYLLECGLMVGRFLQWFEAGGDKPVFSQKTGF
jgi:asparagine synthase (glutamine-hydrolysing)